MPGLHEHCRARTIYPNHRNLKENEVYRRKNRYLCGWNIYHLNDMILELFRYIYYRIAYALSHAKDSWTRFHHVTYAMSYLVLCVYSNILVISMLVRYWMFDIPASNKDTIKYCILYVLIPLAIICFFIWPNDELYMQLDQKYKNEKHRKLKGWLILVYIILSILLPILTMILLWE